MGDDEKIRIACPGCKRRYTWLDSLATKKIRCTCGIKFRMPETHDGPPVFIERVDAAFPDLMVAKIRPKTQVGESSALSSPPPAPKPPPEKSQDDDQEEKDPESNAEDFDLEINPLDPNVPGLESSVVHGDLIEAEESEDSDPGIRPPPAPMRIEASSKLPIAKFNPARRPPPPPRPKSWWQSMLDKMFGS